MNKDYKLVFRESCKTEIDVITSLIRDFSIYVDGKDSTCIDAKSMEKVFFDEKKAKHLFIEVEGMIAGYMVYFNIFSTFKGTLGIYLEDVYIKEEYRGLGIGTKVFEYLKDIARENNYCKIEWNCLKTNVNSMKFYVEKLEANNMDELRFFTLNNWN